MNTPISGKGRQSAASRQGIDTAPWYQETMRRSGLSLLSALAVSIAACSGQSGNTVAVVPTAPAATAPSAPPAPALGEGTADESESGSAPAEQDEDSADENGRAAQEAPARGFLGVDLELAALGETGVRVARVVPHSPAEQAGLLPGDLIERIENEAVTQPADVVGIVSSQAPGTRLGIALKRRGADRLIAVTLGARGAPEEILRQSFIGEPAPDLAELRIAKGSLVPTLAAQRGHVLLIEFWAADCMPCRALIPHMNQLHAIYAARGLNVLGITLSPVAAAARAATDLGMDYPIASDESERTSRAYQANATPMLFLLDRAGVVRDVIIGYDAPRLSKLDRLVDQLLAER